MTEQMTLNFDGETYDRDRDGLRLGSEMLRVRTLMFDGQWRTLRTIEFMTGYPQASISARLRDLRKPKFGGYVVERRYVERGIWEYRLETRRDGQKSSDTPSNTVGIENG